MNEHTNTEFVERRPEGDGETHSCDACGAHVGESQAHYVADGEIWCVPCAQDVGVA